MSATVLERDMLKTAVPARGLAVTTWLHTTGHRASPAWTAVCEEPGPALCWLHFWPGQTTPGGLAEAHEHIVGQVQRGALPAQGRARAAWGGLAARRADDPGTDDRRRSADAGARPVQGEEV